MGVIGKSLRPDHLLLISSLFHLPPRLRFLAYLAADFPKTRKLLQAILDSGIPAAAYVRDASDDLKHALRARGLTIHDKPPPPERAFAEATLIIHHGGMARSSLPMLGRPQLMLTRHLETEFERILGPVAGGCRHFEI